MNGSILIGVFLAMTVAPSAYAGELRYQDGLLSYQARAGSSDFVRVDIRSTHLVVEASASGASGSGVTAGPGCAPAPGPYAPDEAPTLFLCRRDDRELRLEADLGDGNDGLLAERGLTARVSAGEGDDEVHAPGRVEGGPGDDSLSGADPRVGRLRLSGGAGDDTLSGHYGPELLEGGPGRDHFELHGTSGVSGHDPDVVDARDGELDEVSCASSERVDRLLLDGVDWPRRDRRGRCNGLRRVSAPRALPTDIYSAPEELGDGTWVSVYCPHDVPRRCAGTISAVVEGDRLGPARFRLRPGRRDDFKVARAEYDDPSCDHDFPARVTVRTRRAGRMLPATAELVILSCLYDSS